MRREVCRLTELGVGAIMLFGIPATKDAVGSQAFDQDGIVRDARIAYGGVAAIR